MAKKRKIKKNVLILVLIVAFFAIYMGAFKFGTYLETKDNKEIKVTEEQEEDTRTLIKQLKSKNKIYVSDNNVENIKIEEASWDEIKYFFTQISKVRKPEKYEPIYNGYSDDGIRFSTDLSILRIYTVNKEEYYKIPISIKTNFENTLSESIYTSFDLIKQYKTWKSVHLIYNNEKKTIHKWKYDDLSYKMLSKRVVGKVQPEKNKERSEYNFTIDIKGDKYAVKLETMGKDYVKISSNKGEAYYEVPTILFEYLRDEIFKLTPQE